MWKKTNNQLYKKFVFKDFEQAFAFMQAVAQIAEQRKHHPRWQNEWNVVEIWLQTHDVEDVTDKDNALAKAIDELIEPSKDESANEQQSEVDVKLFTDGGSRGNPGPSALGYVVLSMQDEVIVRHGVYLGVTTNNQAEYQSLKYGLQHALKIGAKNISVYMDSMLVVNQMKGIFKVKNRDLWPIHEAIKEIAAKFQTVTYTHVPRELNKLADAEVNKVLDAEKST